MGGASFVVKGGEKALGWGTRGGPGAGGRGPGRTSGDTCCWSSAALHRPSGALHCGQHPLSRCVHYLALPLDTQGPHLYANHPWGPSQQGYTENLHFLSLKLALQVSGELTRCPIGAHGKPFPSGRQCRHQRRPSGAGCVHRCCLPAAHLGGGGLLSTVSRDSSRAATSPSK